MKSRSRMSKTLLVFSGLVIAFGFIFPSNVSAVPSPPTPLPVPTSSSSTYCSGQRDGEKAISDPGFEDTAFLEKTTCEGNIFEQFFCRVGNILFAVFGTGKEVGTATFDDSSMPSYLRMANELLLSVSLDITGSFNVKRKEISGISGSLAKLFPPGGYDYSGADALLQLNKAEAELVSGTMNLNNETRQEKFTDSDIVEKPGSSNKGWYKSASGVYDIPARFGEVAPLYDRFGVLRQALFIPGVEEAGIPSKDCPVYDDKNLPKFTPTPVDIVTPEWGTNWKAAEDVGSIDPEKCVEDPKCSRHVSKEGETYGNLDTKSNVSLTGKAWERIGAPTGGVPNEGGVYNVLLLPGQSFLTKDAETGIPHTYDSIHKGDNSGNAPLFIADLGNVEGSVDCIVNGYTAHPAFANPAACLAALGISAVGTPAGQCTDEATPLGFDNTSSSGIARKAWEIVNKLYQGFWCLWNKKLEPPPKVFDDALYAKDPNPPYPGEISNHWGALYWCTHLVIDAVFGGSSPCGGCGNSDTLAKHMGATGSSPDFKSGGDFISADDATSSNIAPGYVVFFQTFTGPTRTNHVGVVYSVTSTTITFVQSNAGSKDGTITFKATPTSSEPGVFDIPWAYVTGFGKP